MISVLRVSTISAVPVSPKEGHRMRGYDTRKTKRALPIKFDVPKRKPTRAPPLRFQLSTRVFARSAQPQ